MISVNFLIFFKKKKEKRPRRQGHLVGMKYGVFVCQWEQDWDDHIAIELESWYVQALKKLWKRNSARRPTFHICGRQNQRQLVILSFLVKERVGKDSRVWSSYRQFRPMHSFRGEQSGYQKQSQCVESQFLDFPRCFPGGARSVARKIRKVSTLCPDDDRMRYSSTTPSTLTWLATYSQWSRACWKVVGESLTLASMPFMADVIVSAAPIRSILSSEFKVTPCISGTCSPWRLDLSISSSSTSN